MSKIDLPGIILAYRESGEGLPVLLLHGFPLNRAMWQPQFDNLSGQAHLIAPDFRGHGETPAYPGVYTMELLAQDSLHLLEALGVRKKIVVCGLSMGGYVALAFARLYPSRLAGLALVATRAAADTPQARENRDKAADLARSEGVQAVVAGMLPKMLSPESYIQKPKLAAQLEKIMLDTSLEGMVSALMGMKDRPDSTTLLPVIAAPVLIIHGEDDQLIPIAEAESMHAAIPGATLRRIPLAGHLLNLEQPELVNQVLTEFFQSLA